MCVILANSVEIVNGGYLPWWVHMCLWHSQEWRWLPVKCIWLFYCFLIRVSSILCTLSSHHLTMTVTWWHCSVGKVGIPPAFVLSLSCIGSAITAFTLQWFCVSKVKTSRRNSLKPICCPVMSGDVLFTYLPQDKRYLPTVPLIPPSSLRQSTSRVEQVPPTIAWEYWRRYEVEVPVALGSAVLPSTAGPDTWKLIVAPCEFSSAGAVICRGVCFPFTKGALLGCFSLTLWFVW